MVDEVKDNVKLKELPSDINIPVYKLDYINNIFEFVDTIFNLKNNPSPLDGVVDIISGPFEKIIGGKISWYYNGYLIYGEERDFNKNDEFYFEGNKFHFKIHDIVVVGEIGGDAEEMFAQKIIDEDFKKPIVAYVAGRTAPKEKRMGHAGAIVMGNYGSAESKIAMFSKANIPVAKRPVEVPILLAGKMEKK